MAASVPMRSPLSRSNVSWASPVNTGPISPIGSPLRRDGGAEWRQSVASPQATPVPTPAPNTANPITTSFLEASHTEGHVAGRAVDENTVHHLQEAGRLVEQAHAADNNAVQELYDVLAAGVAEGEYTIDSPMFHVRETVLIPQALLDQYHSVHPVCKCFLGIFPEINRVWLTMDNILFLWNYVDGSDFRSYDGLDQIILTAALVKPRHGVLVDEVKYLLVLATPVDIVLVGVAINGRDISLFPTQLSVPSDNVNMLKIMGTNDGRVFMAGRDGCVHELLYQADDGWFSPRCRKINRSSGWLSLFIPPFLQLTTPDPVVDMSLDAVRQTLYSLTAGGTLTVWTLKHGAASNVASYSIRAGEVARVSRAAMRQADRDSFAVVSVHAVSPSESIYVHCVCITSTGARLFFTTTPSLARSHQRGQSSLTRDAIATPTDLVLLHVRLSPSQNGKVHTAMCSNGICLMADGSGDADSLICTGPNTVSGMDSPRRGYVPHGYTESSSSVEIDGQVLAIADTDVSITEWHTEAATQTATTSWWRLGASRAPSYPKPICTRNELATQHLTQQRSFVVLNNGGLNIITKLRPVEKLMALIQSSGGQDSAGLQNFLQQYGTAQVCAMLLIIACPSNLADNTLPMWAQRLFFKYGGEPGQSQPMFLSAPTESVGFMGRAVQAAGVVHSAAHDGLSLHIARLLRPLWLHPIVSSTQISKCVIPTSQLHDLRVPLRTIAEFMDLNTHFVPPATDEHGRGVEGLMKRLQALAGRTRISDAQRIEYQSLLSLYGLVARSLEAIELLLLLLDNGFGHIVDDLSAEMKQILKELTFSQLVSTTQGSDVAHSLVSALVYQYTAVGRGLDGVAGLLRRRAPSYFAEADMIRLKAFELLQRAQSAWEHRALAGGSQDGLDSNSRTLLQQSVDLYLRVPEHVRITPLCVELREMRHYQGVVALCLRRAQRMDPSALAIEYWRRGVQLQMQQGGTTGQLGPPDPQTAAAHDARVECYHCIHEVLEELINGDIASQSEVPRPPIAHTERDAIRSAVLEQCAESDDGLWHDHLYAWLADHGRIEDMLTLETPYIESYLRRDRVECLWRFYSLHGKHTEAAHILMRLAEQHGTDVTLDGRTELLSLALQNIKAGGAAAAGESELLHEIEDKLDVARIQLKIRTAMAASLTVDDDTKQTALQALDSELLVISDLYNRYARPHGLWECCLAVMHCAGHQDGVLIKQIWEKIVDASDGHVDALSATVLELGQLYYPSQLVFPVSFLCDLLERYSVHPGYSGWVVRVMRSVGVPFATLFSVYADIATARDAAWQSQQAQLHIFSALANLIAAWHDRIKSTRSTATEQLQYSDMRAGMTDALSHAVIALKSIPIDADGAVHAGITRIETLQRSL